MVATKTPVTGEPILSYYDDGAGWPNETCEKERAFRQGFLEEARRVAREWADPDDPFDPFSEEEAAHKLRLRVCERYTVYGAGYGPGCAGRKTYHLGYRPGHEVPAARLRGRHHALAYVTQSWDEVSDLDTFDRLVLPAWLMAVEQWASKPIRQQVISPPPRPLEIEGAEVVLRPDPEAGPARSNLLDLVKKPASPPDGAVPRNPAAPFVLRVDAVCLAMRALYQPQAGLVASIMAQQHIGVAHVHHGGLEFWCGESRVLTVYESGDVRLGHINTGRGLGAR